MTFLGGGGGRTSILVEKNGAFWLANKGIMSISYRSYTNYISMSHGVMRRHAKRLHAIKLASGLKHPLSTSCLANCKLATDKQTVTNNYSKAVCLTVANLQFARHEANSGLFNKEANLITCKRFA